MPLFEDLPEEQATLAGPQFAVAPETTTLKPGLFADLPEQPALPTREAVKEETWRELGFGSKLQSDLLRAERGFKSTVGSVPKAISILGDVLPPLDTPLTSEQAAESASWVERQAGKTGAQRLAEIQASDFWRAGEQLQESVGEIPQPESVKRPLGSALEGAGSLAGTLMLAPLGPEAVMGNAFLMELTDAYESEIGRQTQNGEPVNPDAAAAKGLVYASGAMPLEWIGGAGRLARRWFGAAAEAEVKALAKQGGAKAVQQFFVNRIKDAGLEGGTEALQRLWQDAIVMGKPNIAAAIEEGASAFGGTLLLGAAGQGARAAGQQVQGAVDEAQAQAAIERSGQQAALEASLPEQGINYNRERDASFQDIPEEVPETGTDRTATTDESAVRAALAATPGGEIVEPVPKQASEASETQTSDAGDAMKSMVDLIAERVQAGTQNFDPNKPVSEQLKDMVDEVANRFETDQNQTGDAEINKPSEDPNGKAREEQNRIISARLKLVKRFVENLPDGDYLITLGGEDMPVTVETGKKTGRRNYTHTVAGTDVDLVGELNWGRATLPDGRTVWEHATIRPATPKAKPKAQAPLQEYTTEEALKDLPSVVAELKAALVGNQIKSAESQPDKQASRFNQILNPPAGGATPDAGGASEQDSISNHEEKLRYKRDIDDKHGRLVIQERDDIEFFGKDSPEAKASTKALRDFELENAAWIGAARRALAETGNSSSLPNVPKSRGKKKLGDVAVGQPVGNAPPPPRWQPTPGKQAVVNLTSRGRGRLAQVVAVQPDGSAQVRLQGEKEFRWVNADQLRPTGQEAARRAKAAELAEAATPEAAAKMQADAREFDTLVSEFGPHPDLNWLPAEALETTDVKSQGVVAGRLRESGRRNAARAAGVTNYQDNSVADRARALPALEAFLRAQFPGDTSIDRRRALEQFSRGETQPAAPQSEAARRVAGIVRRLAKKPGFELLQGIRAADSRGRGAPKARGSRDAAAAAKPAMEGDAGGVSGGKALVGSAGQKVFSELERLFGVRIVLVDHASGTVPFNGFYDADSRTILIDSRNDKPLLVVAGHELTHHIANTHPVLYQELQDKLVPLIQQHQQYYERMQARGDQLDQGTFKRELIGDFAGDALADPTFLESLARQEPNLFKRFARIAVSWLNKLIEKAKGAALKGYGVAQHVSDLEAARDALRVMLVEAARETQFERAGIPAEADRTGQEAEANEAGQFSRGGYADDYSKSNRAHAAENAGRFPASEIARQLGVPVGFIKDHAPHTGEWHHTSKFYNVTQYYDLEQVRHWMEGTGDYVPEGKEATGNDMLAEWKMRQKAAKESGSDVARGLAIKYLEWGGTRNHPVAREVTEQNVTIERKPGQKMVMITRQDGSTFRKGLETRGFEIMGDDGKWFYADYNFKKAVEKQKREESLPPAGIKTQLESRLTEAESGAGLGSTPRLDSPLKDVNQSSSSTAGDVASRTVPPSKSSRMVSNASQANYALAVNKRIQEEVNREEAPLFSRKEPGDLFSLDAPESVAEQKAREKAERQQAEARKQQDTVAERAAARLTGNTDERTEDMFGGVAGRDTRRDASGQGSLFSLTPDEPAAAAQVEQVEQIVAHELYRTGQPMNRFTVVYRPGWTRNGRSVQAMVSKDGRVTINAGARGMDNEATVRRVVREEAAHLLLSSQEGRAAVRRFALEALTPEAEAELRAQGYTGSRELLADEFIAKQARENTTWWQNLVEQVRAWLAKRGLTTLTPEETARAILRSLKSKVQSLATETKRHSLDPYIIGQVNNARDLGDTEFEVVERRRPAGSTDAGKKFYAVTGKQSGNTYFSSPTPEKAAQRVAQMQEALRGPVRSLRATTGVALDTRFSIGDVTRSEGAAQPEQPSPGSPQEAEVPPRFLADRPKQTTTPEFRRWFADSKIVDENGEPLEVFHGTPETEPLTEFSESKIGSSSDSGYLGRAFYFTPSRNYAAQYAGDGLVMRVFLKLERPLLVQRHLNKEHIEDVLAAIEAQVGKSSRAELEEKLEQALIRHNEPSLASEAYGVETPPFNANDAIAGDIRVLLIEHGFDGVIKWWRNAPDVTRAREIAVFEPTQIKSSIANVGSFDPAIADIRFSLAEEPEPPPRKQLLRRRSNRSEYLPDESEQPPAAPAPPQSPPPAPTPAAPADAIAAAEQELKTAIRQHMNPPEGMTKKEALQAKNDAASKLRRLVAEQLKAMSSANVDAVRSPQETADLISQTVDLLNSIQDEISERTAKDIEVPADLTKLRQDLQTRLNLLKGWADEQTDVEGRGARVESQTGPRDGRFAAVESATDPERDSWGEWWDKIKRGLRYLTSPIPELPLFGEQARKSALFRRGYRLFAVESNRVRKEAADKLQRVLEPLTKLGRNPADNAALQRYYRLGEQLRRFEMDEGKQQPIRAEMARLEAQLERDPFNLFRKIVLYRDLYWRGTYLKTPEGKPITLPLGLTPDDARQELRRLTDLVAKHKDGAAVAEALKRHYELTDELQKSILDHGEIIPEALRNPLYFPHHMIDSWTGNLDRVKPTTEEDFRRYLITPLGSGKLIQSDYLKAMMLHTADVLAHNARVDLVQKYWQPYDISERLKREHGEAWNKPWNLPPGYRLYAPFKKLPLRMDYILSREVLADKLGVLFNDGDLRERMGEVGKVLKVKPEDLHAALVAGEKIQWALPEEIADALEGITRREAAESNPGLGHAIGLPFRKLNSFWKATKLFAPWNWIRYEYGNLSTDAIDKVLAADPGAAKHLARAAREVWASGDPKFEASPEFAAAQREGVFDTVTAGEAGRLIELPAFREFMTPGEKRLDVVKRFLSGPARGSKFREATFRYANFLGNLERLRAGNEPVYAGAFHGDIDALGEDVDGQRRMLEGEELNYAKAAEISLKTFGDYQQLGVAGRWLRQYAVPFWSWQDVNFRYHANQLRNLADGLMGKQGDVTTARKAALRYAGARVISTLVAVGLAKELWNQFGGALAGLWDDDDDLEKNLSATDRRRGHIILGQDANGQTMVVYTPSAWSDIAEWVGGQNMKRLLLEWARGQITLDQVVSDYAKMLGPDSLNKLVQSFGPLFKAPYEMTSGKAVFPDVTDQRSIPAADKWWRLVGTLTDDRIVNSLRAAFDRDFYSQPASEQLQQIILQVRRRDPESWAYYEVREDAADWKEARTGKRFEAGAYDAPEAMALRNFRRAIYRADVANALRLYERLQDYGYTAERLDASIRAQHPLADLNAAERKAFVAGLTAGQRRELDLALKYYGRMSVLDKREKQLFPSKRQPNQPANPALLERIVEGQRRNQ